MKTEDIFNGKKEIIIEFCVGILFVVGIYYVFNLVKTNSLPVTTTVGSAGLNSNFSNVLQDLNKNTIDLSTTTTASLQNNKIFGQLKPYYKTISPSNSLGRDNPFAPYATTRSSN